MSAAISPDGARIATGSQDHIVRLWSAKTGELLKSFECHEEDSSGVWCVAFSPDGERLASGGADGRILVLDVTSDRTRPVCDLIGHDEGVSVVLYSPDGRLIASGSYDLSVKLWNAATGQCIQTYRGHDEFVTELAFSRDGTRVVSCAEKIGKIWEAETGKEIASMLGHTGRIWSLAISKEGDRIATGSEDDHTCRIWALDDGAELVTLRHGGNVASVAWSPDDNAVVSACDDATVVINDSWSGEQLHVFQRSGDVAGHALNAVAWSPLGDLVCSGSADGDVALWDTKTGAFVAGYKEDADKITQILFSPDGRDVVSVPDNGPVRKWSVLDAVRLTQ